MRLVSESGTRLRRASVSTNVLLERGLHSAGISPFLFSFALNSRKCRLVSESDTRLCRASVSTNILLFALHGPGSLRGTRPISQLFKLALSRVFLGCSSGGLPFFKFLNIFYLFFGAWTRIV